MIYESATHPVEYEKWAKNIAPKLQFQQYEHFMEGYEMHKTMPFFAKAAFIAHWEMFFDSELMALSQPFVQAALIHLGQTFQRRNQLDLAEETLQILRKHLELMAKTGEENNEMERNEQTIGSDGESNTDSASGPNFKGNGEF